MNRDWAVRMHNRWGALLATLVLSLPAIAAERLDVLILDRPPYYALERGEPRGFLLTRAARILQQAGVIVGRYEALPPRRILALLQQNAAPLCSVGWFRTTAREAFGQFSAPIHQDEPHAILTARRQASRISSYRTLLALMDDPDLRLGLVDGFSYGNYLDAMIAARQGPVERLAATPGKLLDSLLDSRVDFVLIDAEEAGYLKALHPRGGDLIRVPLPGMPPGQRRYLLCSKQVSPGTMAAIDRAIAAEQALR